MVKSWDHPNPKEALVLIHLSSLDSFADMEREVIGGDENSWGLAFRIAKVIEQFQGPIFIGDQQWRFIGPESRPRARLISKIEKMGQEDITWVHFDEQEEGEKGWEDFLRKLGEWLRSNRITRVFLGGLFFKEDLSEGCVTYVYQFLQDRLPVKILHEAVGSEELATTRSSICSRALRLFGRDLHQYLYSKRGVSFQLPRFLGEWAMGGCWIVAEALHAWIGPGSSLWAIYGSTPFHRYGMHHVVVKVGECYLDGEHVFSEERLLRYWEEDQEVEEILLKKFHPSGAKAMDIPCPARIVRDLVRGLQGKFGDGEQVLKWAGLT